MVSQPSTLTRQPCPSHFPSLSLTGLGKTALSGALQDTAASFNQVNPAAWQPGRESDVCGVVILHGHGSRRRSVLLSPTSPLATVDWRGHGSRLDCMEALTPLDKSGDLLGAGRGKGWLSTMTSEPKCGQPGEGAQAPALCQGRLLSKEKHPVLAPRLEARGWSRCAYGWAYE